MTSNPHLNLPLALMLYDLLNWPKMDGSAIFVLHTFTHTRYCYNWTFHCFPSLTPKYIVIICSICLTVAISQLWPSSMHNHWYHWYTKSKIKSISEYCNTTQKRGGVTSNVIAQVNDSVYHTDKDSTRTKTKIPAQNQAGLTAPTDGRVDMESI